MPDDPVLRTEGLTKHYRRPLAPWRIQARALTGLDLEVRAGEVHGLLGPNGSGKSTALQLLLGLRFPTAGRVRVFGEAPASRRVRARLGYLPEESFLYPFLTPEETIDFAGRLFALARRERRHRTERLLGFAGLLHERRRVVGEFSKGMQRRVALAQSLVNDPELLVLDEPTTGLDAIGIAEIKDLIRRLRERGKTVLLSSHRMDDVEDVCDRVTVLCGGRVQASGAVSDFLHAERGLTVSAPMSEPTAAAAGDLIREREGPDTPVRVAPARERLEAWFLRVVREARERDPDTSGARDMAPLETLDFLGSAPPPSAAAGPPAGSDGGESADSAPESPPRE